jgi:Lhr-like helicase
MMALSRNGIRIDEFQTLLHSCAALRGISDSTWKDLLKFWVANDVIRIFDDMALVGAKIEQRYASINYRDLYVLFDSPSSYEVHYGRSAIGTLDSLFVQSKGREFVFILAGQWWKVVDIDYKEAIVFVKPIRYVPPPAQWISPHGHEIGHRVAQRIKAILLADDLYPHILAEEDTTNFLLNLRRQARMSGLDSSPCQIMPLEAGRYEIITYAGDQINFLLTEAITDLKKWKADEINYASFQIELDRESSQKNKHEIQDILAELGKQATFDRPSLNKAIASKYDVPRASKWSEWLPPDYRCQAIKSDLFDIEATKAWLKTIQK